MQPCSRHNCRHMSASAAHPPVYMRRRAHMHAGPANAVGIPTAFVIHDSAESS
jgi:hypothetical protein